MKKLAIITLILLTSCASVVKNPAEFSELKPQAIDALEQEYVIGAGDNVALKFFYAPELNDIITVRPDGKISLPFVHDIKAAGKTPEQLAGIISKKLAHHLEQPEVSVSINDFASQKVFVIGEVNKPGAFQLTQREDLLQVLGEAGWVTPASRNEEIVIIRKNPEGKKSVYHANINQILSGEDIEQDVLVLAGDVIFVPPSNPVEFDRWIDRNVKGALPFNTNAGYYIQSTSGTIIK